MVYVPIHMPQKILAEKEQRASEHFAGRWYVHTGSKNMNWWIATFIYPSIPAAFLAPLLELCWEDVLSHLKVRRGCLESPSKAWFRHNRGLHEAGGSFCSLGKASSSKRWSGKMGDYWALIASAVPEAALLNIASPPTPPNPIPAGKAHLDLLWQPLRVSDWVAAEKAWPEQVPAAKSFISLASVSSSGSFS